MVSHKELSWFIAGMTLASHTIHTRKCDHIECCEHNVDERLLNLISQLPKDKDKEIQDAITQIAKEFFPKRHVN